MRIVQMEETHQGQLGEREWLSSSASGGWVVLEPMMAEGHQSQCKALCLDPVFSGKYLWYKGDGLLGCILQRNPSGEITADNETWLICPDFIK